MVLPPPSEASEPPSLGDFGEWYKQGPSCKWCKLKRSSQQPLLHLQASKPFLCWRRADGSECAICPRVMESDDKMRSMDRKDLKQAIVCMYVVCICVQFV